MKFFEKIGKSVQTAVQTVEQKNRSAAQLNRIRAYIRSQEKAEEQQFLALGRYYYHTLRDSGNVVTEGHCTELDSIEANLKSAREQLDFFYSCEHPESTSIGVIHGEDGPTAVFVSHKNHAEREEVTLDDVQCFDTDPAAADPDENADLPFEG